MRWLFLLVLLGACSDPEPEPPEVEPVEDEELAPEPEVEPDPESPAEPSEPVALELPDEIEIENLPSRTGRATSETMQEPIEWSEVRHPDPGVRATLAAMVESYARQLGARRMYSPTCEAPLATERLVSFECHADYDIRGGVNAARLTVHYAIADGQVVPVSLDDSFLPGTDLSGELLERCEARRRAEVARIPDPASNAFDYDEYPNWWMIDVTCAEPVRASAFLTAEGVTGVYDYYNSTEIRVRIPWSELRGRVRADGPLAPVLTDGSWAPPRVTEGEANGWALTGFGLEDALIARWVRLETDAPIGVDRFGGGLARLVVAGGTAERAAELARGLGEEARPVRLETPGGRAPELVWDDWDPARSERTPRAVPLRWVRTTEDLNLRESGTSSGNVSALLPAGSLVAAIGGALRRPGEYVEVWTPLGPGYLASRHLRAHQGCVPAVAREVGGRHVAKIQVRRAGSRRDAWLLVDVGTDRGHVALREARPDCALGDEILSFDVEGHLFDVRTTGTTEHGGSTIVVAGVSRRGSGELRYLAHRVGSSDPVLELAVDAEPSWADRAVRLSETVDGDYFPVSVGQDRRLRRFAWSDGRLMEASPE